MKNKIGMGALCVLMVLVAAGMFGCKQDEGDRWVSSMGAPKIGDIKSLAFKDVSPVVKNYGEAKALVHDFLSDNMDSFNNWPGDSFNDAFKAKYDGLTLNQWQLLQGQSYSYSVNINDTDTIKKVMPTAEGTIKGSEKASWSHNRLTYIQSGSPELDGDKQTTSSSYKRTISITSGYAEIGYDDWKVAGIVKKEGSSKWEKTTQKKAEDKKTESYSQKSKTAGALLIDDGTRAAKIRFSTTWDTVGKTRNAVWLESSNHAPVEVWNLEGTEILFTIPESEAGYY